MFFVFFISKLAVEITRVIMGHALDSTPQDEKFVS
jgi:hypothetical protein